MASSAPHPDSPSALAKTLGLHVDTTRHNKPAIMVPGGKPHFYCHGQDAGRKEATAVLRRLIAMRKARQPGS